MLHTPWRVPTSMATVLLSGSTNTFCGVWSASTPAPYPDFRFIPHRRFCLPKTAHREPPRSESAAPSVRKGAGGPHSPIQSLRIGRGPFGPDTSNHSLYPTKPTPVGSSYPEGNFGGNQLLDGSISLSPLYPSRTIDLHVRTATGLHQSFLWLRPPRA